MARKSTKLSRNVNDEVPDWISTLPSDLISRILSLVPTKYAIRTSSLSKRLNPLRASLINLEFDDEVYPYDRWSSSRSQRFKRCVTRVLASQNPWVARRFYLRCTVRESRIGVTPRKVNSWAFDATNGGSLEELHLEIFCAIPVKIPNNVFESTTLVNLSLHCTNMGNIVVNLDDNTKIHLPNLKTLHVISVIYKSETFDTKLFEGCPVLEEFIVERRKRDNIANSYAISGSNLKKVTVIFTVEDTPNLCDIQISCPKLEYICIWNALPYDLSIEYPSSITEAHFCMCSFGQVYAEKLLNIFKSLTSVKYLSLSASTVEALASLTEDNPPPMFRDDIKLEIVEHKDFSWSFSQRKDKHQKRSIEEIVLESWWLKPENRPKWLWEHLTELSIIVTQNNKLQMLPSVLREAKVLKKVPIQTLTTYCSREFKATVEKMEHLIDCIIELDV